MIYICFRIWYSGFSLWGVLRCLYDYLDLSSPCGSINHLVKDCTKRKNYHNKESILVECVNEDLLHVDEYVSDTESIYSIISSQDLN